jgi:hypothetical protein
LTPSGQSIEVSDITRELRGKSDAEPEHHFAIRLLAGRPRDNRGAGETPRPELGIIVDG